MNTRQASEGKWLRNGDAFVKAISGFGDLSGWQEVDDAEKQAWDAAHQNDEPTEEPTTEEQNEALLNYANRKTGNIYADLGEAVKDLVNV